MENEKYTDKKGIVYLNQYHIVFCPKYRRKVLVGDIERDLKKIFEEVAKEHDVQIKAMEIMPDHVHLFISFDPRQHLRQVNTTTKTMSTTRKHFPNDGTK